MGPASKRVLPNVVYLRWASTSSILPLLGSFSFWVVEEEGSKLGDGEEFLFVFD